MKQKEFKEDKGENGEEVSEKVAQEKTPEPILQKYKRPEVAADAEKALEDEEKAKRLAKEKQRRQGRMMPSRDGETYEKSLVLVATKGIV